MNNKNEEISQRFQENDMGFQTSHSLSQVIIFFRESGILLEPSMVKCTQENCQFFDSRMEWKKDLGRIDEGRFKCKGCQEYKTLRYESIFDGTRKSLVVYYRTIFCAFANNIPQIQYANSLGLGISLVNKTYQFCRKVVSEEEEFLREYVPLGTQEVLEYDIPDRDLEEAHQNGELDDHIFQEAVIEADETLLTHNSTIDNVHESQIWAVGLYERGTEDFRVVVVGSNRNEDVLRNLFERLAPRNNNVLQRIMTDGWRGYSFLEGAGYVHDIINHDKGFGSGRYTTNHIENLWSRIKSVGQFNKGWKCNSSEQAQLYVDEVCWRIKNRSFNLQEKLAILLSHTKLRLIGGNEEEEREELDNDENEQINKN